MKFQGEEQGSEEKLEENFRIGKNRGPAWFRPLGVLIDTANLHFLGGSFGGLGCAQPGKYLRLGIVKILPTTKSSKKIQF